jgi:lipopolysaccharide export LptBFGC system permease protein LptF
MRALDRHDKDRRWEPVVTGTGRNNNRNNGGKDAQLVLELEYNDFLLLTQVRRGLPNLQMSELFNASKKLAPAGYIPQVFEAELLNRISFPLFFLPMMIFSIIIGWRFRAKKRPRSIFIPMLPVMPLIFYGLTLLYRNLLNSLGIWAVISLGFPFALGIFIAGIAVIFVLSLIFLAAQRG